MENIKPGGRVYTIKCITTVNTITIETVAGSKSEAKAIARAATINAGYEVIRVLCADRREWAMA